MPVGRKARVQPTTHSVTGDNKSRQVGTIIIPATFEVALGRISTFRLFDRPSISVSDALPKVTQQAILAVFRAFREDGAKF